MSARDETVFVGIAASAGGLEAASALVKHLPREAHAVYIMAQHMSPRHKSLLSSLISRETALPVVELSPGAGIEPDIDTIYITPPKSDVTLSDGKLVLSEPAGHAATPKPSADRLFKSLAAACGDRSVGIVLSGTGSDGSYGVQAIREAGGITIAQDTATAKYDGMPASAIETGCIDLTLTAEQIGQHLEKILATPRDFNALRHINDRPTRLSELLQILQARTRVDFRDYKENTVNRRISRRMVALNIEDYNAYVDYCRSNIDEVDALYRDLLISVTRFFRDPRQFDQLRPQIARIVSEKDTDQIRVWVAGCATGEEAYSIAILVAEAMGGIENLDKARLQVFATDIDERALDIARRGIYPITAAHDIPDAFLERYFKMSGSKLEVAPELRSVVLFPKHNLFQDPPFINVDLITLRNVLIYFNTSLQERVLARTHYALAPGGVLFLGTSETVGALDVHFETVEGTDKVYTKRGTGRNMAIGLSTLASEAYRPRNTPTHATSAPGTSADTRLFDALAKSVAPNGFIATRSSDIIRVFGDISAMLELTEDSALSLNTRILRGGLRDESSSLITIALKTRKVREGRWHNLDGPGFDQVQMACYPVMNTGGEDHCLIALHTRKGKEVPSEIESLSDKERTKYILQIEDEMQSTREALQQTVEELQTSNEELQSVNEELQSTNEELQSTNEELETSNEELQSTNEELITVNEEMQVNSAELQKVTTELSAVLAAAPYPLLVVDQALIVRRASETARTFFGINELLQTGMHLSQCSIPAHFPNFTTTANEVFKVREMRALQVEGGQILYDVIFNPFSDPSGTVLGLTISVIGIDLNTQSRVLEVLEEMGDTGHFRLNLRQDTATLSQSFRRAFGMAETETPIALDEFYSLIHRADRPMVIRKMTAAVTSGKSFRFEARVLRPDSKVAYMLVAGTAIDDSQGDPHIIVGAARDVSTELNAHLMLENLEHVQDTLNLGMYSYDVQNREVFFSRDIWTQIGVSADSANDTLESAFGVFSKTDRLALLALIDDAVSTGEAFEFEGNIFPKSKKKCPVAVTGLCRRRLDGSVSHVYGSVRLMQTV